MSSFVQKSLNIEIGGDLRYVIAMTQLPHPDVDQITLANVLTALGDETRLAIIGFLARNDGNAMTCGQFYDLGSKTTMSYHIAKLREAGVVNVRPDGTKRLLTLRRDDLDSRFPGLLDSVIATSEAIALTASAQASLTAASGWDSDSPAAS